MADLPEPRTRLEQYWAGILEKIEGGGGGNPNYVEEINGTLENPWGSLDKFNEIHQGLVDGSLTAYITYQTGFLARKYYLNSASISSTVIGSIYNPPAFSAGTASRIVYLANGTFSAVSEISVASGGTWTNVTVTPTTNCKLVVIHHPLPEQS